ncbi:hypothetical protein ABZ128_17010 [Streptomyces sp. NPDC006326]|uniref:hypothetical protein n=1 Tax=Streptomyces sp. NPDC006326 TaxID=3156752 RepID=UPI0033A322ED
MFQRFSTRRIVLAGASVALLGGGIALPATAMAAPVAAPQHVVTLAPADSADGIGTGGDSNAENTTVGGNATGGNANSGVNNCEGGCDITTGPATGGNASADAINQGDATSTGGNGTGNGGIVSKSTAQVIKDQVKENLKAKLGK